MEVLTDSALEQILRQLEAYVTELEDTPTVHTFYAFVLLAEAFARRKPPLETLLHLRRYLTLARRVVPIRDRLLPTAVPWRPVTAVGDVLHGEATKLATLYGGARLVGRQRRRALSEAFRRAYAQTFGHPYSPYNSATKTAQERATITRWWEETLHTAWARLEAEGTPEALDDVLGCLPAWTDRSHERWTARGWHEPTIETFMPLVTEAMAVWEACLGPLTQVAEAALAQAAVMERAQVAPAIEAQYAAPVQEAQAALAAVVIPAEAPRAQKTQLRREQNARRYALQTLLDAQEAAITRQVKQSASARQKLETLVKLVYGYPVTLRRKLGKTSVDVLPQIVWIYACEREGGEIWRGAKLEVRRFLRTVPPPTAVSGAPLNGVP